MARAVLTVSPVDARVEQAARLMTAFAERTGVGQGRGERRYLWTDAFAVCNLLGLAKATGEPRFGKLALSLVDGVHHTLGTFRPDDVRTGWLSGLSGREAEAHPTRGGLRIGKPLPERRADEPLDEDLEWDRDGQYFHYLTQWMHALNQVARARGESRFNAWARELAEVSFHAFGHPISSDGRVRLVWKMSVDLSRPLVTSTGQHDALDGFVTCAELRASASAGPDLSDVQQGFAQMLEPGGWTTSDPLGIGGLLIDGARLARLTASGALDDARLLAAVNASAQTGLGLYALGFDARAPASRRLGFRELGLAIGLHAGGPRLDRYQPLRAAIEEFWLDPKNREAASWTEHRDINEVMLATALAPDGFLS